MKRVAFFLNNSNSINCTDIKKGNPGLGGTEYQIILIASLLAERKNGLEIVLLSPYKGKLPPVLYRQNVSSFYEASLYCVTNQVDYLIVNYTSADKNVISAFARLKYIIWCHNFVKFKDLDYFASERNILRVICVSNEQLDLYRDHKAFDKSDYIFNTIPCDDWKEVSYNNIPFKDRQNNVLYIGSLIECKGFCYLAKAWPRILASCKDANLYVIGKGNLYNEGAILGSYGLADSGFEAAFMPYLTDSHGKILPSVHFLGIMGKEKIEVMSKCKVGVPNPGGETETFGLTAVEMQMMGMEVTTIICPGYLDTVYQKENLYQFTDDLADRVVNLLKSRQPSALQENVWDFIYNRFSYEIILPQWERLLCECLDENSFLHHRGCCNPCFNYHSKRMKDRMRKAKSKIGGLSFFPAIERFYDWDKRIRLKIQQFI